MTTPAAKSPAPLIDSLPAPSPTPTAATPGVRTPEQQVDDLWKTVGRYDAYTTSVNAKASLLAAFNTFVLGGVVLKWTDILGQYGAFVWSHRAAGVLLAAVACAAIVSLGFTFVAAGPYLRSPKVPLQYHSLIFFGHVGEIETGAAYRAHVGARGAEALAEDLCFQAHTLAQGLQSKFAQLTRAVRCLLYGVLGCLGALVLLKLVLVFVRP